MEWTFQQNDHTYYIDGVKVPSVTELCSIFGNDIDDPLIENAIEVAADRGVTCHKVLELLLSGVDIHDIEYPEMYSDYVYSILSFLNDNEVEPISLETPICDTEIMVAGTPDMLCYFNGDLAVLDWKFVSQVCKPKVKAQLGGYDRLYQANGVHVERLVCVQFLKDAQRVYEVSRDGVEFDLALRVYQAKHKKSGRGRID